MKKLWKGTYNYHGELHTLYRRATIQLVAEELLIRALAQKLSVRPAFLKVYFEKNGQGWKVEEVKEVVSATAGQ